MLHNRMLSKIRCSELLGPEHLAWVRAFPLAKESKARGTVGSFAQQLRANLDNDQEALARLHKAGIDPQYFSYLCEYWFIM